MLHKEKLKMKRLNKNLALFFFVSGGVIFSTKSFAYDFIHYYYQKPIYTTAQLDYCTFIKGNTGSREFIEFEASTLARFEYLDISVNPPVVIYEKENINYEVFVIETGLPCGMPSEMLRWTDIYGNTNELLISDPGENVVHQDKMDNLIGLFAQMNNKKSLDSKDEAYPDYYSFLKWDNDSSMIRLSYVKESVPQRIASIEAKPQFGTENVAYFDFTDDGWENSGDGTITYLGDGTVSIEITIKNRDSYSSFNIFEGKKIFK